MLKKTLHRRVYEYVVEEIGLRIIKGEYKPGDTLPNEDRLCKQFDVIKEKKLYGRTFMGIERSTFLIDSDGILRSEWRKVRVPGHVDTVLQTVQALD